jgi:hypothetical protein
LAISRRRGTGAAPETPPPEPGWLVRKTPPGAPLASTPERDGMVDYGDEAQIQAPGRPPNLALHEAEGDQAQGERALDETTRNRSKLP